jgi:hypothetical protein
MDSKRTVGNGSEIECPSIEIGAYIDGELSPEAETSFETHIVNCSVCTTELNYQKQFVNALNGSLNDLPELPADFTKRVVINAESSVNGLRQSKERFSAMFVCCALFFFILFTLGASAPGTFAAFFNMFAQLGAVAGFFAHVIYDISIGVVVIMRTVGSQPSFPMIATVTILPVIIGIAYRYSQIRLARDRVEYSESGSRL